MTSSLTAYREKMREMSVVSLLCSCFSPQPRPKPKPQPKPQLQLQLQPDNLHTLGGGGGGGGELEVKALKQRAWGQSFQLILKEAEQQPQPLLSPPKKEASLEELQRRLEAAQERRKSQEALVMKQLAEKRERVQEVLVKAREDNNNFSKKTEEKLIHKMEVNKEKREAHLNALKQRLRHKEAHAAEVRRNKERQAEVSG